MMNLDDEDAFLNGLASRNAAKGVVIGDDELEPEFKGFQVRVTPNVESRPEPVPYEPPPLTKRLCTVDTETDPFLFGRSPQPFWVGFYDGEDYIDFWGDDCVERFFDYLITLQAKRDEEMVIYAHNGGKFDFHLFMDYMDDDTMPFLINGRVVKVMLCGVEFRDSFAIIPVAQSKFVGAKLKISYDLFEREVREQHREVITTYARHDVISLWEIVNEYIKRFGWRLTVAGTALPYLNSFHGFEHMEPEHDATTRKYYAGGRVQCFETGLIIAPLMMVDSNSHYPTAMKYGLHPVSAFPKRQKDIDDDTDFAYIEADNFGALGSGSALAYDFTVKRGKFFATIHEIRAGLDTGTLHIRRVISAYTFTHKSTFADFVDTFYNLRLEARASNDKMGVELYKLVLNSAYGKLAMNTSGYRDWLFNPRCPPTPVYAKDKHFEEYDDENGDKRWRCTHSPEGWSPTVVRGENTIYSRPARGAGQRFLNVATAASITGLARANLWRAICASKRVVYCDTDSMICESTNVELDNSKLGAWKIEARGDAALIAGKKMYAFLSREKPKDDSECVQLPTGERMYVVKKAHKGVQLTGTQIAAICQGAVIEHENIAPAYSLDGKVKFTKRRVRMTASGDPSPQMELDL